MAKINLSKIDTRAPKKLDKEAIKKETQKLFLELDELQNVLYAEKKHSLLILIQGMDASGKDGLINDVFSNLNPQGIQVKSWKAPTDEELSHDFLWRIHQHTPSKGMIQIHNRSHYEDILITRVHNYIDNATAQKRITAINNFEQLLTQHANTTILKFYLHISHTEQLERLNERINDPTKMWKWNANDIKESELWDEYMKNYTEAIEKCNAVEWNIIPADQNWYKNYLVTKKVLEILKSFRMKYPILKK